MDDEINLNDYLKVIFKWWYLIVGMTVILALFIGLPTLFRKDLYEAKATLLIKKGGGLTQNPLAGLLGVQSSGGSAGSDAFPSILSSRIVADKVLDDLNLIKRIKGWDDPQIARQDLISEVQSIPKYVEEKGLFEIKVITIDPALSADLANEFAQAGADFWSRMNYTEARKKREYIESQLPRVESDLRKAENTLKNFSLISPNASFLEGVEYRRLEREYKIQDESYTMLRKEYESAKLEESKELEPFTMIDKAVKPLKPIKPKVLLRFAIGTILGLFGGTFLAFGIEYFKSSVK